MGGVQLGLGADDGTNFGAFDAVGWSGAATGTAAGPQMGWKGQGRKSADEEMGCLHFLPKGSTRWSVNGDWYGTRAKLRKLLRSLAQTAARGKVPLG
jgi:hypothetical protein